MSNDLSKTPKEDVCDSCGQTIADRCPACGQFIVTHANDDDTCSTCGQELPDDEEEDEFEGHEFIKQKDGTQRALCTWCERPYESCPKCERLFDSGQEDETDDEDETDEEESDEDTTKKRNGQSGGGRKHRFKNF